MLRVCIAIGLATTCGAGAAEFETENIFPLQDKHVHGSSIVECPNGDFLACWFHGSGERTAHDVVVQGARLKKGADTWSPVFLMADSPGFPDCNPVLYIDAEERLWLFWVQVLAHGWQYSVLKYRRAEDYQGDGPPDWSWQDAVFLQPGEEFAGQLKAGFDKLGMGEGMWAEYAPPYTRLLVEAGQDMEKRQLGWMTRLHPITLPTGRILLPLYSDGFNVSLAAISDDLGETWRPSAPIVGAGPIQPALVRKKDGTIVAYMRDSGGAPGRIMAASSNDDGETWSVATDTELKNPGSSIEAINLRDGRWLMIFNDSELRRNPLAAGFSSDEGKSWKVENLEPVDAKGRSFEYPSVIQARDGRVHMTYTYKEEAGKTIRHGVLEVE